MNKTRAIILSIVGFILTTSKVEAQLNIELDSITYKVGEVKLVNSISKVKIFDTVHNVIDTHISFDPSYKKRKDIEITIYHFFDTLNLFEKYDHINLKSIVKNSDTVWVQKLPSNITEKANFLFVNHKSEFYLINITPIEYLFNFNNSILFVLKNISFSTGENSYSLFTLMNRSIGFNYGNSL